MKTHLKTAPLTAPDDKAPDLLPHPEQEALLKEVSAQKDLYLRLAADFENFKRRSRQDFEARANAQKEAFIVELLPVIDNFERALASGSSADLRSFHQGIEMTWQQLQQLLRLHGVEPVHSSGKPFNPQEQEAVSESQDPTQADQAVLSVLQRGYRCGDKMLRPARVVVNNLSAPKESDHVRGI